MALSKRAVGGALVGAAVLGAAGWARKNPSACPYSARWTLELPRPYLTVARLMRVLEPRPGERLLEVGPGTGYHALPVAERIRPDGVLDVFDLQQEMLDDLARRARDRGIEGIRYTRGDARELPYGDATFDGAYLVTVLGEIPDQEAAIAELRRVLKPGARLVVGEIPPFDPHFVRVTTLRRRAEDAGLSFDWRLGPPALGYLARFSVPSV